MHSQDGGLPPFRERRGRGTLGVVADQGEAVTVSQHAARHEPDDHLASDSTPAPMRLLVVDDHPAVRVCLRALLDDQPNFRVVDAVGTAAEALAVAEGRAIDLAVVDYQLGGRSGLWVSRELKRLPRPPRVVILLGLLRRRAGGGSGAG